MKLTQLSFTILLISFSYIANAQFNLIIEKENLGFDQKEIAAKKYKSCQFKTQAQYFEAEGYSVKNVTEKFKFDPATGLVKEYEHKHDAVLSTHAFHRLDENTKRAYYTWEGNTIKKIKVTDVTARNYEFVNTVNSSTGNITEQLGGSSREGYDDYKTVMKYNDEGKIELEQLFDVSGKKPQRMDYVRFEYPSKNEILKLYGTGKVKKKKIAATVHEYYNAAGQITEEVFSNDNRNKGALEQDYTRSYEYDNLGRLVKYTINPSIAARKAHYTESWHTMSISILVYTYEGDSMLPTELVETIDFNTDPGINRWYKTTLYFSAF